jgi:hypothetical protein
MFCYILWLYGQVELPWAGWLEKPAPHLLELGGLSPWVHNSSHGPEVNQAAEIVHWDLLTELLTLVFTRLSLTVSTLTLSCSPCLCPTFQYCSALSQGREEIHQASDSSQASTQICGLGGVTAAFILPGTGQKGAEWPPIPSYLRSVRISISPSGYLVGIAKKSAMFLIFFFLCHV